jgi:two-component system NarL family response regulator
MPTRILLVDDHRVVVEGLRVMLDQEPDMEVVGIAEDGRVSLSLVNELRPDVVVMDIGMPQLNGTGAAAQIHHDHPKTKVIALSTYSDRKHVRGMLEAGAHGYVTKATASNELLRAIRKVVAGRKYLSSDVTEGVIDGYMNREVEDSSATSALGGREREVLQLIAEGKTSGEIATILHISTNTVDTHRRNVMKKLDLHSVADLTKYAIREGLTEVGG